MNQSKFSLAVFRKKAMKKSGPISATRVFIYTRNSLTNKEYGVTEVTLFPVGGKVFLQQTSEC